MQKTYAKLLIFMAMAAALIGCPPTEEAVKISFSANGGVGTMADQDATVGMETTLNANEFDRAGYEFDGWNTTASGSGNAYPDKGKITVAASVKLYAQWKPAPLQHFAAAASHKSAVLSWDTVQIPWEKIEIRGDGFETVTVTSESETVDAVTIKNLENGEEYAFTAAVTSGGKTSAETTVRCRPTSDNAAVLLTFDSNPPEGLEALPTQTQIVYYGASNRLDENTFTYAQGVFAGWSRDPAAKPSDSNLIQDQSDFSVTDEADIENGITLYAVWRLNQLESVAVSSEAALDKLIGGKTITFEQTLTPAETEGTVPYIARVEVSATPEASFAFDATTGILTLPSNTTEASVQYSVTLTYHTVDENGDAATIDATTSDSATLTLTVYPDTWVVFNNTVYKNVRVFDFTDVSTLSDVKDGENEINSVSEEGYVFSISPTGSEKKSLNFSLIDSENIVLTMIEAKWDRNNCANIFVAGGGNADYGWSPFKGNYSFMLGVAASGENSGQRWNSKNDHVRLSVNPTENTFNKYFVFDNGVDNATLGFNDEVRSTTAAITSKGAINRISSISSNGAWPLTFQHANGDDKTNPVTYTIKTVAFYKAAE